MFETRSKKQRTIIYAAISLMVTFLLVAMHYIQGWNQVYIIIAAIIEYICIFYILYLPLKLKGSK
jgi:uncharacterized membrane protein